MTDLGLTREEAKRLRSLHAVLSCLPAIWLVVACLAGIFLPAAETELGILVAAGLFLGSIVAIFAGLLAVERRICKAAAMHGGAKWKILGGAWLSPFGHYRAVDEFLAEAVRLREQRDEGTELPH